MSGEVTDPLALFFHVRMFLGMIVSFSLVYIIRNYALLLEKKESIPLYWVHQVWVFSTMLMLVHFWWWELRFSLLTEWTFSIFLFLVGFALLLGTLCFILLPEHLKAHSNYRDYFYSHRKSFFSLLALVYVVDLVDTWLKGAGLLDSLGPAYLIRNFSYIIACLIAIKVRGPRFHAVFAVCALGFQIFWIFRVYERL